MKLMDWLDQKVLILGLGKEGQSVWRFLRRELPDLSPDIADRRALAEMTEEEKLLLDTMPVDKLHLGGDYLNNLKQYDLIIKSPGVNPRLPALVDAAQSGVQILSATNIFFAFKKGQVIAVTGSKGKSTTASLIYAVLRAAGKKVELIGNIGRPALDFLDEQDAADRLYVFEMSSYQLEDFQGGASIAVLVNFFPEHLDYHESLDNYFRAKMRLVEVDLSTRQETQTVIYNAQTAEYKNYFERHSSDRETTAKWYLKPFNEADSFVKNNAAWVDGQMIIAENDIQLQGKHNLENILAVYEVARLFQVPLAVFQQAMRDFQPLEHRLEKVGVFQGITFYNDAISTTPESTMAAIEALQEQQISTLIAGGMDRGYQFEQLAQKILAAGIENLLLLPETGWKIAEAVKLAAERGDRTPPDMRDVKNMEEAVELAYQMTKSGCVCLMSCAAPSYNLFKNFEERGRRFKEAVRSFLHK